MKEYVELLEIIRMEHVMFDQMTEQEKREHLFCIRFKMAEFAFKNFSLN